MASNMGRGIIAPDTADKISSDGVTEMRTIAATTSAAIGNAETSLKETEMKPLAARVKEIENVPRLPDGSDLNALKRTFADTNEWRASKAWGATNAPADAPNTAAKFSQFRTGPDEANQRWEALNGRGVWVRFQYSGVWSVWEKVRTWEAEEVLVGADLDAFLSPGPFRVRASQQPLRSPFPGESYTLEVLEMGQSWHLQRATNQDGVTLFRSGVGSTGTNWGDWAPVPGSGSGAGSAATGGEARTQMEVYGTWTTHAQENAYLGALSEHREITRMTIGRTVESNPIYAFRVGDPTKPAVLIACGQHGNEPGSREGAMIFGRELAQAVTFATYDLCVVVIPTINVDRLLVARSNANGVNLNRDWIDRAEPETRAVAALFSQYDFIAAVDAHSGGYARQVSIREAEGAAIKTAVRERSQRLYDAVFEMYEGGGYDVRRYSDEPVSDDPTIFRNGVALVEHIPTLLLEVPAQWASGMYSVNPHWQATAALLCFREALDVVWRERAAFSAAKTS